MTAPFFDSNVVLYLLSGDAAKAGRVEALLEAGGTVSVQVLNEVTAVCRRKLGMSWEDVDAVLAAVKASCEIKPLTLATHEKAIEIAKRFQLSLYDASILSSAILSGVSVLLSEDMQHGMHVEGLHILSPFQEDLP